MIHFFLPPLPIIHYLFLYPYFEKSFPPSVLEDLAVKDQNISSSKLNNHAISISRSHAQKIVGALPESCISPALSQHHFEIDCLIIKYRLRCFISLLALHLTKNSKIQLLPSSLRHSVVIVISTPPSKLMTPKPYPDPLPIVSNLL